MAGTDGRRDLALSARLAREPYRFDLRQAVRLLELVSPRHVPLGAGSDPRREAVSLRGSLSSSFPASDIEALSPGTAETRPEMTATFLGLGGAFGPLPPPLTARVLERVRQRDDAGRDFLDLFNHRLLSLLIRHARLFAPVMQDAAAAEMPARTPLTALLGLATLPRDHATSRLGNVAAGLLEAAGLLNQRPASAHAVERLLAAYFGLPIRVVPLRGRWLTLDRDQQACLGRPSATLGRGAVLGRHVWDQAAGIRLEIGPAEPDVAMAFLPGGAAHAALATLIRFMLGDALDIEVRLSVPRHLVPQGSLGLRQSLRARHGQRPPLGPTGSRLGWTAWLGGQPRRAPGVIRLALRGRAAETR